MATGGVVKYGQKALGAVLAKLSSPDPLMRSAAVGTAITILRMNSDAASQARILALIRNALRDREFLIRSAALYQIDNLHGEKQYATSLREFIPALQDMAQRDPFIVQGETNYPLRARAKVLLDKLAKN